jgi:hypothetical protein
MTKYGLAKYAEMAGFILIGVGLGLFLAKFLGV